MYNDLNPKEKLIITPEEQKKDVSNVFVCAYDNISVGLFKRINYSSKKSWSFWGDAWNAGLIYEGLDSDYIGIKETH